jgi:hypothetical protein
MHIFFEVLTLANSAGVIYAIIRKERIVYLKLPAPTQSNELAGTIMRAPLGPTNTPAWFGAPTFEQCSKCGKLAARFSKHPKTGAVECANCTPLGEEHGGKITG